MYTPTPILLVPPYRKNQTPLPACTVGHMAYRIAPNGTLLSANGFSQQGGMMVLCDPFHAGNMQHLIAVAIRECHRRNFTGVIYLFEGQCGATQRNFLRLFSQQLAQHHLAFFVPAQYASFVPNAFFLVSSALSGGNLELQLRQTAETHGGGNTVLAIERVAEDFPLPALNGNGKKINPLELQQMKQRLAPTTFFSPELCMRYFTYRNEQGNLHLVLFDDEDTICKKMELAQHFSISHTIFLWEEIVPWISAIFKKI